MLREVLVFCYLAIFKIVFNVFKLCPLQNKVAFVISFEENIINLYREMNNENLPLKKVIICNNLVSREFQMELKNTPIIPFKISNIFNWLFAIYNLSTSRIIIIDNYYAFLSAIEFKKYVECIQLWHAAGALKEFGLRDKSVRFRTKNAQQRFKKVYKKFNKIVVGSEEMAKIFMDSFGVQSLNILRTGIPRTDFFYEKKKAESFLIQDNPDFKSKKIILYAPTYRDGLLKNEKIHLDIKKMYQELKDDFILLIKMHPAVKTNINYEALYPNFIYDYSSYKRVNELLLIADCLITDYSSIPFEYSLLKKPMIFFPYDLDNYRNQRGLIDNYEHIVPGPIAFNTDQIINFLLSMSFNLDQICEFSNKWNEYSDGNSSKRLVRYIFSQIK